MPDTSTRTYSLTEAARIIGVDTTTLHTYAHKGLIDPQFSNDTEACLSKVDCVRLKVIKRADQLGYTPESIFDLIGHPDDVLRAANPVAACREYALGKYKQFHEELNHCEPLEQINKQCDLKLVTGYIKSLKALQSDQTDISTDKPQASAAEDKPRQPAEKPRQVGKKSDPPARPKTGGRSINDIKRIIPTNGPKLSWPLLALTTGALILGVAALLLQLGPDAGQSVNGQSTVRNTELSGDDGSGLKSESPPPDRIASTDGQSRLPQDTDRKNIEQSQELALSENLSTTGPETGISKRPPVKPGAGDQPEAGKPFADDTDDMTSAGNQNPEAERKDSNQSFTDADATSERTIASADTPQRAQADGAETDSPPALVQVDEVRLWYDETEKVYESEFRVLKNHEAGYEGRLSGYAFILLAGEQAPPDRPQVVLPRTNFENGRPTRFPRVASFAIRNLKDMRFKTYSPIPPTNLSMVRVLVYSSEGDLLLEKPLDVTIEPRSAQSPPQPRAAVEKASEASKRPETAETNQVLAELSTPISKPQATGDPQAAVWEKRSYEAAARRDLNQTIADATKAIELDPGRINPYITRSWAYIEKGMLREALQNTRVALAIDPQNPYANNNQGLALQRMGRSGKALESYRKACNLGLELGCQNARALENQSRVAALIEQSKAAFKNGDWNAVIRKTSEVIDLDPENAVAYTNRSAAYTQKNLFNKALEDSNQAVKFDADFDLAYNNRGYVYELLGNKKKAASDYLKSCSLGLQLGCRNYERLNQR